MNRIVRLFSSLPSTTQLIFCADCIHNRFRKKQLLRHKKQSTWPEKEKSENGSSFGGMLPKEEQEAISKKILMKSKCRSDTPLLQQRQFFQR